MFSQQDRQFHRHKLRDSQDQRPAVRIGLYVKNWVFRGIHLSLETNSSPMPVMILDCMPSRSILPPNILADGTSVADTASFMCGAPRRQSVTSERATARTGNARFGRLTLHRRRTLPPHTMFRRVAPHRLALRRGDGAMTLPTHRESRRESRRRRRRSGTDGRRGTSAGE